MDTGGKHNMWDASLRVPLFIKPVGNGTAPGEWPASIQRIAEHVGIYPTLCALTGLLTPEQCEGQGFLPLFADQGIEWKDAAVSHRKHMWHDRLKVYDLSNSLRTQRYRYTEYLDASGGVLGVELFDYDEDPLESRNLAGDAACQSIRAELSDRLRWEVLPRWWLRRRDMKASVPPSKCQSCFQERQPHYQPPPPPPPFFFLFHHFSALSPNLKTMPRVSR